MDRRELVRLGAVLPAALAVGCGLDHSLEPDQLIRKHDLLLQHFNAGETEQLQSFLTEGFSFVDGSAFGDARRFQRRLKLLFKYHKEKGNLPLAIVDRFVGGTSEIGWVGCRLVAGAHERLYGFLTQIYRSANDDWRMSRHHFSKAALS